MAKTITFPIFPTTQITISVYIFITEREVSRLTKIIDIKDVFGPDKIQVALLKMINHLLSPMLEKLIAT